MCTFTQGTFENYLNQWVIFIQFCCRLGLVALPAMVDTLVCFCQYLGNRLKVHGSLTGYLAGVKKLHALLKLPVKSFTDLEVCLLLQGLKQTNTHVLRQALPMMPAILEQIYEKMDFSMEFDCVFWCVCLFAFYLLFRKSNLIPDTQFGFNSKKQLRKVDLVYTGDHMVVGI